MASRRLNDLICEISFNGSREKCNELLEAFSIESEPKEERVYLELTITRTSKPSAPPPGQKVNFP